MKRILILIVVASAITMSFCQTYPGTFIDIAGGTFIMGNNDQPPMSNDQDPEHSVTIDNFKLTVFCFGRIGYKFVYVDITRKPLL